MLLSWYICWGIGVKPMNGPPRRTSMVTPVSPSLPVYVPFLASMVPPDPANWNAAARSGVAYQSIWIGMVAGQMPASDPLVAAGAGVGVAPHPASAVVRASSAAV